MKNIFLLSLAFFLTYNLSAQKIDYDNTSKLFMGVNLGGTWNTTDVKYKLGAGWGLIGLCPGPAISSIALLDMHSRTCVISMFVGFYLVKFFNFDNRI